MAVIANLDVNLNARTAKFDRGLDRSQRKVKTFSTAVRNAGSSAGQRLSAGLGRVAPQLLALGGVLGGACAAVRAFVASVQRRELRNSN